MWVGTSVRESDSRLQRYPLTLTNIEDAKIIGNQVLILIRGVDELIAIYKNIETQDDAKRIDIYEVISNSNLVQQKFEIASLDKIKIVNSSSATASKETEESQSSIKSNKKIVIMPDGSYQIIEAVQSNLKSSINRNKASKFEIELITHGGKEWFDFNVVNADGNKDQVWRKIRKVNELPGMEKLNYENDFREIKDAIHKGDYASVMSLEVTGYYMYVFRRKLGNPMYVQDEYVIPSDVFRPSMLEMPCEVKFIDPFNIEVTTPDGVKKILECKEDGSMVYDGKVYREPLKIPRTPIIYPVESGKTKAPTLIEEGKNADGKKPLSSVDESKPKETTVLEQTKSLILPAGIGLALASLIIAARLFKN